ncbi:leucine-rich repeat protein [Butyrivibrio sp. AE3004]|uniref:leucine-rich repeat protein n=1 Tax=Butyrivibrio sp. AE3004 TaxID=1506994 RepID=UPI0004944399|nr:leucine-rich repeat protein [Butyrivibrio sp. AE3004]
MKINRVINIVSILLCLLLLFNNTGYITRAINYNLEDIEPGDNKEIYGDWPIKITKKGITYKIYPSMTFVISISNVKKAHIDHVIYNDQIYYVNTITASAGKGNKSLTTITIGPHVKNIEDNAFYNCKKLKQVIINNSGNLNVGRNAFRKIGKNATILLKGAKGNSKQKLIKKISKQTNATIK